MFERTKNLNLSIIKQIELEASAYPDAISLAQGIPSFDTPGCIKRRVENALKRGVVSKYSLSPGLPELRELIELSLTNDNMHYDWETEIIVTVGTIEGITASILAITEPGDEILIPEPTYTSYREVITLAGCKPVFVPLNEEGGWAFQLDKFEKAITERTKAIFYCNPNNPTGTIYNKENLLGLAEIARKKGLYIISDEVYKDFVYGDTKKIFSLAERPEYRDRVIRLYGFSKAYAMTGWRIGYIHSDAEIVKEILKVHDSLVTCAPVVSQYAAMGALEMGEADVENFNHRYAQRRDLICRRLNELSHVFDYVYPESCYYVFSRIKQEYLPADKGRGRSWEFALDLLHNTRVATVPGSAFGPNGENHIRLSFGRDEKQIDQAFDRMQKYFSQ